MRGTIVAGRIAPAMGKIIKVDMSLKPKRNMNVAQLKGNNSAYFVSRHFGLVGPEGVPLALVGEERASRGNVSLSSDSSSTTNWQGEGNTGEVERTVYFLGSGAPGAYQVWFKDVNVGTAELK